MHTTTATTWSTESAPEVFRRLGLGDTPEVTEALRSVSVPRTEIHPPCPLHESLEWRLSTLYWREAGLLPFAENAVPYVVNNSGRLSENVAVLLFENLCERPPTTDTITVIELGAGSGLFARLFLDAFREVCRDQQRDFYDRLRYVVSDGSPRTVEQWRERRMFEPHGARVVTARIDALDPTRAWLDEGRSTRLERPRAVLCNYVLDVLPATVWRKQQSRVEELLIATHLVESGPQLAPAAEHSPELIRASVREGSAEALHSLLPLLPLLEMEVRFDAPRPLPRWGDDARALLEDADDGDRLAVNFGALDCLDRCCAELDEGGFVLINDYGAIGDRDTRRHTSPQRFGRTVAVGLSFPLLERSMGGLGLRIAAPPGDDERGVHTRLVSKVDLPRSAQALAARFSSEVERALDAPVRAAREHAAAGRQSDALDAYRAALERTPKDWHLLGEIAEFVGIALRDFRSGVQIARGALDLNPWTSTWLWNVLGDCLYYLERYDDAHEAFLQAQRIDPSDVRTNLNLGHSFANVGQHETALTVIARGLAHDQGAYRSRLLQKQDQVLAAIAGLRGAAQDRLVRRLERLGSG